jgi:chaperonin GroEL
MPSVKYDSSNSLHEKILRGVDVLANNVASTLGPRGRNVILRQKGQNPFITKDGVTVAKFVHLDDPFEDLGAQILKQASEQTAAEAGDGTTTSTVLARAILKKAQKHLAAGLSPVEIKRGIDKAVIEVVANLEKNANPISSLEDIEHIARISANGDESIGKLIATAVDQTGKDGAITIHDAKGLDTSLELLEGFRFDSGYLASAFITDERRGAATHEGPLILVTDHKIEKVEELLPVLEIVSRDGRALVIIAEEIEGQALAALIMNTVRGTMKIIAIKAPRYGQERRDILSDIAVSVGATFVTKAQQLLLSAVELEHLGKAKSVEALRNLTTIVDGNGDPDEIDARIEALKIELTQTDDMRDCDVIQERITRLASGIAVIKVGGATEVEMTEKRHRIEDALEAVRSAQKEGVLVGGGVALLRAVEDLCVLVDNDEQEAGVKIIREAAVEPLRQIAENAGVSADLSLQRLEGLDKNRGLDFTTNEIVDMIEAGIIDPVKVTRCALQNAASAASTLLTTNYAICEM